MALVHLLKVQDEKYFWYYVESVHKTEDGAIKARKRLIDKGTYKPEELRIVARYLEDE